MANVGSAHSTSGSSKIGRGVVVRGTIRGDGDLTVEGRVEGTVDIRGEIDIADSARVRASVSGDRVVVRGAVAGDVAGRDGVVLEEGARVVGDLSAPSIGIRPGGLLRGYVSTTGKSAPAAAAKGAARSRVAPVATPAPRAQRPAALARSRDEAAVTAPAASQRSPSPVKGPALPKPPARPTPPSPTAQRSFVEPIASPMTRPAGKSTGVAPARESSAGGPPPPVVPALKKGARGSMKKKAGR